MRASRRFRLAAATMSGVLLLLALFPTRATAQSDPVAVPDEADASVEMGVDEEDGSARLRVRISEDPYPVKAETLTQAIRYLNGARLQGPGGPLSQGLTRYHIRPRYRAMASGGRCRVEDLAIEVEIVMTLPTWPAASTRPPSERRRWSSIEEAIREHEEGHRDLTLEAAEALYHALEGRSARGCGTLGSVVDGQLSIADGRLRDAHAAFDRETPRTLTPGGDS